MKISVDDVQRVDVKQHLCGLYNGYKRATLNKLLLLSIGQIELNSMAKRIFDSTHIDVVIWDDIKLKIVRFNGSNANLVLWRNNFDNYKQWGAWDDKKAVLKYISCLDGQALRVILFNISKHI
eukprot:NODE_294_length_10530_cov_0.245326.p5 type:complete len:123 gc:universal NODE_294_length_10530_cov_0.245326:5128-5496(+)